MSPHNQHVSSPQAPNRTPLTISHRQMYSDPYDALNHVKNGCCFSTLDSKQLEAAAVE